MQRTPPLVLSPANKKQKRKQCDMCPTTAPLRARAGHDKFMSDASQVAGAVAGAGAAPFQFTPLIGEFRVVPGRQQELALTLQDATVKLHAGTRPDDFVFVCEKHVWCFTCQKPVKDDVISNFRKHVMSTKKHCLAASQIVAHMKSSQ